jgi:hypothetical protein
VKEQSAAYLEKARELLDQAETIFAVRLYEQQAASPIWPGFMPRKR